MDIGHFGGYGSSFMYFDDLGNLKFYPQGCGHHSLTAVHCSFRLISRGQLQYQEIKQDPHASVSALKINKQFRNAFMHPHETERCKMCNTFQEFHATFDRIILINHDSSSLF